jgi:hypothetical protein
MTKPKPARSRRKPPATPGERLRTAILATYELNPAELLLLDQAGAVADALARLNAEVAAEQEFTGKGSKGQPVASPLLAAQRGHSEALARLPEAIALPASGEDEGHPSASQRARRAATVRWARETGVR